jgi:hypothetical protein
MAVLAVLEAAAGEEDGEIFRESNGKELFTLKKAALHDLVNQRPEAIALLADAADNGIELGVVQRSGRRAGGVGEEFPGQIAGELILVRSSSFL